eukprot:2502019-Amphidinium_carterae.1
MLQAVPNQYYTEPILQARPVTHEPAKPNATTNMTRTVSKMSYSVISFLGFCRVILFGSSAAAPLLRGHQLDLALPIVRAAADAGLCSRQNNTWRKRKTLECKFVHLVLLSRMPGSVYRSQQA